MPCTPLRSIDSNITYKKELTLYARGIIKGMEIGGSTPAQIATQLNLPRHTIRSTIQHDIERDQGLSKIRSGRPKEYTDRDERTILRLAQSDPKQTYQTLIKQAGVKCSRKTVYRILSNAGIINWIAKKRPLLRE